VFIFVLIFHKTNAKSFVYSTQFIKKNFHEGVMCEVVAGIMCDTSSLALKPLISLKLKYLISVGSETLILNEVFFFYFCQCTIIYTLFIAL